MALSDFTVAGRTKPSKENADFTPSVLHAVNKQRFLKLYGSYQ